MKKLCQNLSSASLQDGGYNRCSRACIHHVWGTCSHANRLPPNPKEKKNSAPFLFRFVWKVLLWLLRAETAFFPCFFLPPPPLSGQAPPPAGSATAPISIAYPLGAESFVMWGMTFGVVSKLAVAGGGAAFAYQGPPYFR